MFLDGSSRITIRQGEYVFISPAPGEAINAQGCSESGTRALLSTNYRQSPGASEKFVFDQPDSPQVEILTALQTGSDLVVRFIAQGRFFEFVAPTTLVTKTELYSEAGRRCENSSTPYKFFEYAKMKKTGLVFLGRITPEIEVRVSGVGFSRTYKLVLDSEMSQMRIPLEADFFSKVTSGFFQLNIVCNNCVTATGSGPISAVIDVSKFRAAQAVADERARVEARQRMQDAAAEEKLRLAESERKRLDEERAKKRRLEAERQAQQQAAELERQAEARRQEELKRQKKRELLRNL